ncbi:MAG TPA: HlyD family type I secretion periplasmic adaptor subunit [Alphaproteobacteria bacterium]|nr:HlyD family type I secretion periplasmic adaptor subunit [Alphaproteobacteria bacterium]
MSSDSRAVSRLLLEFQSDARAIEEGPVPTAARLTLYALLAFVIIAIAWAALSLVDQVVVARGRLITTASNLVVQPLETSIVRSIDVKTGDIVRKGDRLGTLDQTFTEADAEQLRARIDSLGAQVRRLQAELDGQAYKAPANATPDERLQEIIGSKRTQQHDARLDSFDKQIARAEAGIKTKRADQVALNHRLAVAREVETMRGALFAKEVGSRLQQLEAQSVRLQIERDLQLSANEILELQQEIARTRAEREAFIQDWRQKTAEELVSAGRDLDAAERQLDKAKRRNALVDLTAPADAIVLEVAQRSIGSVLREAEPLFTLVPIDVPIEAEVSVDARDIGLVRAGAPVRVKLDAYPFQKHGTLEGMVRTISEDSFTEKESAQAFYRARVTLTSTSLRDVQDGYRLIPGMTVAAEIKSGERSVLSYFLYPLIRGLDESIREP